MSILRLWFNVHVRSMHDVDASKAGNKWSLNLSCHAILHLLVVCVHDHRNSSSMVVNADD